MKTPTLADRVLPAFDFLLPFFTLNLLWIAVSLPLLTLIPATAALLYAMNRHAHGRIADWSLFFEGLRRWFWRSYLWGGLNIAVLVVLASNIVFYTQLGEPWALVPTALAVVLLIVWLVLQVLMFPLMLQQERPSLRLALRNSLVLVARRPLRILGYFVLISGIIGFSIFVLPAAWVLITASLSAYLMNRATLSSLRALMGPAQEPAQS
jgi:uncharacterized membrane protein YesL